MLANNGTQVSKEDWYMGQEFQDDGDAQNKSVELVVTMEDALATLAGDMGKTTRVQILDKKFLS